jgi:OOP family OmpA-OmpF porin
MNNLEALEVKRLVRVNLLSISLALVVNMCLFLSLDAMAAQTEQPVQPWYIGAKAGWSHASGACEAHALNCDNNTTDFGVFAGYELNKWLDVEVGYTAFDDIEADYPALENSVVTAPYKGGVQGIEFSIKPHMAINEKISVFARGGGYLWDMDVRGDEISYTHNASDSDISLLLGGGLDYKVTDNWSVLLEGQWIRGVGGNDTGGMDFNSINLGVIYHFSNKNNSASHFKSTETRLVKREIPKSEVVSLGEEGFPSNSKVISPQLRENLQSALQYMNKNPSKLLIINVHSDGVGSEEFNQHLSDMRAEVILEFFMDNGIQPIRLKAKSYGERYPVASDDTPAGRYKNRRVELIVVDSFINTASNILYRA